MSSSAVAPPPANAKLPAVEPVICLDEFNREVPPLGPDDPELQRPLESMGEFEQILLSGQGATVAPGSDAERTVNGLSGFDFS